MPLVSLGLKVCERQQKKKERNIKTCVFKAEGRRRDVPPARMKSSEVLHIFRH